MQAYWGIAIFLVAVSALAGSIGVLGCAGQLKGPAFAWNLFGRRTDTDRDKRFVTRTCFVFCAAFAAAALLIVAVHHAWGGLAVLLLVYAALYIAGRAILHKLQ